MNGVQHYLWRAVDQNGATINILVQPRRDRWAALRLFRKLLAAAERAPQVIVTDKLRSYAAAKRKILPGVEHMNSRYLNNRAENSHQPSRGEKGALNFSDLQDNVRFLSHIQVELEPGRLVQAGGARPLRVRKMEPTMEARAKAGSETRVLGSVVQIDEGKVQAHLDEVVRSTVEETLNALLDAEADQLCGAGRYERSEGRKDTRAGSYERQLHN